MELNVKCNKTRQVYPILPRSDAVRPGGITRKSNTSFAMSQLAPRHIQAIPRKFAWYGVQANWVNHLYLSVGPRGRDIPSWQKHTRLMPNTKWGVALFSPTCTYIHTHAQCAMRNALVFSDNSFNAIDSISFYPT